MIVRETINPPRSFWIVAVLALLWSCAGCFAYVTQTSMGDAELSKLPKAQRDIWAMMPGWVTGAYAIAVWSGLVASIALLLRRAWARPLYIISLIAVIVQFGWTFLATPIMTTVGPSAIPFPAFIITAAAALSWFSGHATLKGWLR